MKILVTLGALVLGLATLSTTAIANGFTLANRADNPNTVAYYPSGLHGIVGEPGINHEGEDLVMKAGKSGNFLQWFCGTADENGGVQEGEFSLWQEKEEGKSCPDNFIEVDNAYPAWGDYLKPGADYCVKTHDFTCKENCELPIN